MSWTPGFSVPTPDPPSAAGGSSVSDTAYDEAAWNGATGVAPSKNAVRDKIEVLQPLDSDLTAIAALTTTAYGRAFLALANAAAARAVVLVEQAAIPAPTGGTVNDVEARTAINSIRAALQANDITA